MSSTDIASAVEKLTLTSVTDNGIIDFSGQGLKLNSEDDAQEIVEEICKCTNLHTLNIEGNSLGVVAAKAIAKSLESHPELKRILWKDLFTGRLKDEIPEALSFLSSGLMLANAKLIELDLSDNALGPIGMKGINILLESPVCYQLQELRLNNNGLGTTGGQMLAEALTKCYENCTKDSQTFCLRVFICGRNRLENDGATALAEFFKIAGTLEEIEMPQNGIYHEGISALATAFANNQNLQVINLNDNTATEVGTKALANAVTKLQKLRVINLGDCLLRCGGIASIAAALKEDHHQLENVNLSFNEVEVGSALVILDSLKNKKKLQRVELGGNVFGPDGCKKVEGAFDEYLPDVLGSLSEDEGGEEDDSCNVRDLDEEEDEIEEIEIPVHSNVKKNDSISSESHSEITPIQVTAKEFLESPTPEKFLGLGNGRSLLILQEIDNDTDFDRRIQTVLKICSCVSLDNGEVKAAACECADALLAEVFELAEKQGRLSVLSNSLLVQLGLIKSEDKTFKPVADLMGPLIVLEHVVRQSYFSRITRDVLQLFMERPNKAMEACEKAKRNFLQSLCRF